MRENNGYGSVPLNATWWVTLPVACGLVSALAGCQEYKVRSEVISPGAGDAVAVNRTTHTIDPWPEVSRDPTGPTDGNVAESAVDRYQRGKVKRPSAQSASKIVTGGGG